VIEQNIVCDFCGQSLTPNEKRAEIQMTEYSELHREGYIIPAFNDVHLHWDCYKKLDLLARVKDTDGNS
jgi:hypothetical protein